MSFRQVTYAIIHHNRDAHTTLPVSERCSPPAEPASSGTFPTGLLTCVRKYAILLPRSSRRSLTIRVHASGLRPAERRTGELWSSGPRFRARRAARIPRKNEFCSAPSGWKRKGNRRIVRSLARGRALFFRTFPPGRPCKIRRIMDAGVGPLPKPPKSSHARLPQPAQLARPRRWRVAGLALAGWPLSELPTI